MLPMIAARGGYQSFEIQGGEWLWLVGTAAVAAAAVGAVLWPWRETVGPVRHVDHRPDGAVIAVVALIVVVTSTAVERPDGSEALPLAASAVVRTLAFLAGAAAAWLTAITATAWTPSAEPETVGEPRPVTVGSVDRTAMAASGLGLLAAAVLVAAFERTSLLVVTAFALGVALVALSPTAGSRTSGGAPLGGWVGTAAAGPATLAAALVTGIPAFGAIGRDDDAVVGAVYPIVVLAIGMLAAFAGPNLARLARRHTPPSPSIPTDRLAAAVVVVVAAAVVVAAYVGNDTGNDEGRAMFLAVTTGVVLRLVLSRLRPVATIVAVAGVLGGAAVLGDDEVRLALYLVTLVGVGALAVPGSDGQARPERRTGGLPVVLATLAVFAAFVTAVGVELGVGIDGDVLLRDPRSGVGLASPVALGGLLLGAAFTLTAAGRPTGATGRGPLLPMALTPVAVGFGIGPAALGALVVGAIVSGLLLRAVVHADPDDRTDVIGLVLVSGLTALIIVPAVVAWRDDDGLRLVLAAVAVALIATSWSARRSPTAATGQPAADATTTGETLGNESPAPLATDATLDPAAGILDRWLADLGDEPAMRDHLRRARDDLHR